MKNINKLKKGKKENTSIARKEIELECFKRITVQDIPLNEAVDVDKLRKTLTKPESTERERVVARILLNPNVQKTISELREKYGDEFVETFLKENMSNIRKNSVQRLSKNVKAAKSSESEESSDDEVEVKTISKSKKRKLQASKKETKEVELTVDSFFMKPTGENYLASVKTAAPISSEDEDKPMKKQKVTNLIRGQKKSDSSKPKEEIVAKIPTAINIKQKSSEMKQSNSKSDSKPQAKISEEADIHPSWKAKSLMRKTQIQAFQGTKIKFDE